LATGHTLAHP